MLHWLYPNMHLGNWANIAPHFLHQRKVSVVWSIIVRLAGLQVNWIGFDQTRKYVVIYLYELLKLETSCSVVFLPSLSVTCIGTLKSLTLNHWTKVNLLSCQIQGHESCPSQLTLFLLFSVFQVTSKQWTRWHTWMIRMANRQQRHFIPSPGDSRYNILF